MACLALFGKVFVLLSLEWKSEAMNPFSWEPVFLFSGFCQSKSPPRNYSFFKKIDAVSYLVRFRRYLVWVRKNKRQIDIIRAEFNQKEDEVRSDHEFDHVLESDIEAMEMFRKAGNLGPFVVEDDTTVGGRSYASRSVAASSRASSRASRHHSLGGSVSSVPSKVSTQRSDLSPLPEERDGETEDDAKMGAASPGNSTLASSRMFSPASKMDDMTTGSHEDEDSV